MAQTKTPTKAKHVGTPRKVKPPKRRIYKRQDKRFKARPKLGSAFKISRAAARLILANWKVVGGIVLVYCVLNILLVRGLSGGLDVSNLKAQYEKTLHGFSGHVTSGLSVFALLVSSSGNTNSSQSSAYQTVLFVLVSLALIWSYRQISSGQSFNIRDAFYKSTEQMVPSILILFVLILELLPMLAGVWLFGLLTQNHLTVTGLEQLVSGMMCFTFVAVTIYLLCSSIFAFYIVTLPGVTPFAALRSARELVRYRRWALLRKLLFLPLAMLVITSAVILPIIFIVPGIAQWSFFILSMLLLAVVHAYLYSLYRELLNE